MNNKKIMNIPTWLIYGISASLCWGSYAVVSKIITSKKYFGIQPAGSSLLMLGGITIVFILYFILRQKALPSFLKLLGILLIGIVLGYMIYCLRRTGIRTSLPMVGYGLLQGILWASGMIFVFMALSVGAEVAKLAPIYNTNTLVAVILSLLLLNEIPTTDNRVKVIIGAILIVIGGILASSG